MHQQQPNLVYIEPSAFLFSLFSPSHFILSFLSLFLSLSSSSSLLLSLFLLLSFLISLHLPHAFLLLSFYFSCYFFNSIFSPLSSALFILFIICSPIFSFSLSSHPPIFSLIFLISFFSSPLFILLFFVLLSFYCSPSPPLFLPPMYLLFPLCQPVFLTFSLSFQ